MRSLIQKTKVQTQIKWSPDFAYFVGVVASDGCLYNDGRHINVTSKDREMVENIKAILNLSNKIGIKSKDTEKGKNICYVLQFGNVVLYKFLVSIGITSNKSKTIKRVEVPDEVFSHFLRGLFDGDGTVYSYFDKRWKNSFMFYTGFASASPAFVEWLSTQIGMFCGVNGHVTGGKDGRCLQLRYAKEDSIKLIAFMYKEGGFCLTRKKLKIKQILAMMHQVRPEYAPVLKLVDIYP